eukprot:SM000073S21468  [mRNA]  locus=s73:539972:540538:+ [translate_table: standard]
MAKVLGDDRLAEALGPPLQAGPWYNASIGVAHEGHSASCTFPVVGAHGNASVRVKAVRIGGGRSTLWYNTVGPGRWDILVLVASVQESLKVPSRRINLLQPGDDGPKIGDVGSGKCEPCRTTGLVEA